MTVTQWPFPIWHFLVSSLLFVLWLQQWHSVQKCWIYCALCWMGQSENNYLNQGMNSEICGIYLGDLFKCLDFVDSCHFCCKSKVFSQSCLPLYAPFNTARWTLSVSCHGEESYCFVCLLRHAVLVIFIPQLPLGISSVAINHISYNI